MTPTQSLVNKTQKEIEAFMEEGLIVTTAKDLVMRKAPENSGALYQAWSRSKDKWLNCHWKDPLGTFSVLATIHGFIQYTSFEWNLIKYRL